jgi:hypothetical protein
LFEAGLLMSVTFQAAIANLKLKGLSWNRLAACASVLLGTGRMAFFTYFLLYFLMFGAASDNMYLLSKYNFANSVSLIAFLITLLVQILIGPSQSLGMSCANAVLTVMGSPLNALLLGMLRLKGWCRLMPLQDLGAMAKQRNELLFTG